MFSVLFSTVLQLRYEVMKYVREVTSLRPGCDQNNVAAGQRGTGEER